MEVTSSDGPDRVGTDQLRVKRETLQAVLDQCQRALELLRNAEGPESSEENDEDPSSFPCTTGDSETDALCDLLKSRVESPNFLEKLGSIHMSVSHSVTEEGSSWDLVTEKDLWEGGHIDGQSEADQEGYVLVRQEDIVDGIACFMAAYLLSLKQTKELTPNQLQEALSKTFSIKKKKGKLQKAWDGSKVIYNVASWGATAIGFSCLLDLMPGDFKALVRLQPRLLTGKMNRWLFKSAVVFDEASSRLQECNCVGKLVYATGC